MTDSLIDRLYSGRSTGEASAWSAIVTMLATLDISLPKDDQGKTISFSPTFVTGVVRYFSVSFYPLVTNSFVALAVLRSSPVVFRHGLILI